MHLDYVVDMRGIRKEFPGVVACDNIDFKVKKGEIELYSPKYFVREKYKH